MARWRKRSDDPPAAECPGSGTEGTPWRGPLSWPGMALQTADGRPAETGVTVEGRRGRFGTDGCREVRAHALSSCAGFADRTGAGMGRL